MLVTYLLEDESINLPGAYIFRFAISLNTTVVSRDDRFANLRHPLTAKRYVRIAVEVCPGQ